MGSAVTEKVTGRNTVETPAKRGRTARRIAIVRLHDGSELDIELALDRAFRNELPWTELLVLAAFQRAWSTVIRLPLTARDMPSRSTTAWPEVLRTLREVHDGQVTSGDRVRVKPAAPSSVEITRADTVLGWFAHLTLAQWRLVLAHAGAGVSFRALRPLFGGVSHETLRLDFWTAIYRLLGYLNRAPQNPFAPFDKNG
jgi:hypothetical protein